MSATHNPKIIDDILYILKLYTDKRIFYYIQRHKQIKNIQGPTLNRKTLKKRIQSLLSVVISIMSITPFSGCAVMSDMQLLLELLI